MSNKMEKLKLTKLPSYVPHYLCILNVVVNEKYLFERELLKEKRNWCFLLKLLVNICRTWIPLFIDKI